MAKWVDGRNAADSARRLAVPYMVSGLLVVSLSVVGACSGETAGTKGGHENGARSSDGDSSLPKAARKNGKIIDKIGKDSDLASRVPNRYSSKKQPMVGTDASLAPGELMAEDGKTIVGYDPDLGHAAGKVLGLKMTFVDTSFDSIIPSIKSGKYDLALSSAGTYKKRAKVVDFATTVTSGLAPMAPKDATTRPKKLSQLCGSSVSVNKGSVEETVLDRHKGKCADGKSLKIKSFKDQDAATLAVRSGRAQYGFADLPTVDYTSKKTNGKLIRTAKMPDPEGEVPQGAIVKKTKDKKFAKALSAGINKLIKDGQYQRIMKNWGLSSMVMSESYIVPNG